MGERMKTLRDQLDERIRGVDDAIAANDPEDIGCKLDALVAFVLPILADASVPDLDRVEMARIATVAWRGVDPSTPWRA